MSPDLEEMSAFFNDRAAEYDAVHIGHLESGAESKRVPALYLPEGTQALLDLGIGTGLELNEIYGRFPDIRITGYDIARDMLDRLVEKFPDKAIIIVSVSIQNVERFILIKIFPILFAYFADDAARHSERDGVFGNIVCDDAPRSDDGVVADIDARYNLYARAYPHIFAYPHGQIVHIIVFAQYR